MFLRNNPQRNNFLLVLCGALVGLVSSIVLSNDFVVLSKYSDVVFRCDINSVINCGSVARHWSSHIFFDIPNAFIGMAAFPVFVTIAVLGLSKIEMPKWFMKAAEFGAWIGLIFAGWMFYISYNVIQSLCPWCLLTDVGVLFMLLGLIRHNVQGQNILYSRQARALRHIVSKKYDFLIVLSVIFMILVAIFVKFGNSLL